MLWRARGLSGMEGAMPPDALESFLSLEQRDLSGRISQGFWLRSS